MNSVKFAEGSDTIIEGLAIPFGGPEYLAGKDFHGEDFGPDTDIVPDLFPDGRPIIYHHGLHHDMKVAVQGRQTEYEMTDEGVFARGELDKAAKYHATVAKLIRDGKLFFSSGAIPHLVKTNDDGHITRWPWMELSLTPTPANPNARVTYAVKATDLIEHLDAADLTATDALKTFLDSNAGLESEPFAVHAERVSALMDEFADRVGSREDARTKSGRSLSAANRAEVAEVIASIDHLRGLRDSLAELIARSDPVAVEAAKAEARAIEAEYLRLESRMLGVAV